MPAQLDLSRRQLLKGGLAAIGLGAFGGLATGCGAVGLDDTLERIKKEGVVRIGHAGERPFAYRDETAGDGVLVGAMPAVHREVFARIGDIEVEGVETLFRDLADGLNAGRFDVIGAGMFVNAPRCDRISFSAPVYCGRSALLVAAGNPKSLTDYASVADAEARLAVLGGAVEQDYARSAGIPDSRVELVGDQIAGLRQVAEGDVDAFTLTSVSLRALVDALRDQRPEVPGGQEPAELVRQIEVLDPFAPVVDGEEVLGCGAAGFRRTDGTLVTAFNDELNALRREGRILDLTEPFGFTEAEMPEPGVTTEQLCRTGGVPGAEIDPLPR
ncbi:transporter substrate-binding domain-containing protein [Actinophytocola sp.]|uniref:transporter substrate-binding domain-containing protein n=1 Tax=Actinophytocola sp. TaxID=1872138 RepID=UPI003D6C5DCB